MIIQIEGADFVQKQMCKYKAEDWKSDPNI